MNYYHLVKENGKNTCYCRQEIRWNVKAITRGSERSGFIVQHFMRKLIPTDALPCDDYKNTSYYEAWEVVNGQLSQNDASEDYDDAICIGEELMPMEQFRISAGTKGEFIFSGDVYWIPKSSPLFHIICDWSRTTVKQAEGLRAVYQFDDIHGIAPLFRREPFCHSWDLTTQEAIYQEAREEIYRYCREDRELLLGTIEHLLAAKIFSGTL